MKSAKRAIQLLALGACVLAVSSPALAEAQRGFYIGLGVGQSTYDLDKSDFDGIVRDAFFSAGAPVISMSSSFDDSDTSASLVFGYRFLKYVAVEASFINLGTAEYRSTGNVNPPGPIASTPSTSNIQVESKGFTIAGIGSVPLGNVVDLHGRLGLFVAKTELSVGVTIGSSPGNEKDSLNSVSALIGVGAGFHLGDHWSLALDWTRYANVGDENDDDDFETEGGFDVDTVSFSANYRF